MNANYRLFIHFLKKEKAFDKFKEELKLLGTNLQFHYNKINYEISRGREIHAYIDWAFTWSMTKYGVYFWATLNSKWVDYFKNHKEHKSN